MTADPDAPTEPLRRLTRPLSLPVAGRYQGWSCGRCLGPVEAFGQGHYQSACRAPGGPAGFHFCCPQPAGCELAAGAVQGARRR